MNGKILLNILTLSLCSVCTCMEFAGASEDESEGEDLKPGVMSFKPPDLNDEEAHSFHMPSSLKCDGCKIVAYQLSLGLKKAEGPKSKKLKESEILDVTESVCSSAFQQYGIKDYKGQKHLSGPGMPANDAAGVVQGGGKWPQRLEAMCSNYLGELGEEELYEAYRDDTELVNTLCKGKGVYGLCSQNKDEL